MATEKDDKKKPAAKPAAAKPAAKAAAKPAEKAAAPAAAKPAKAKAAAKPAKKLAPSSGPPCRVEGCKQGSRAKGYCRKHFLAWRRGKVGDHHRYKICTKEGCRKPRTHGSLCDEHAGKGAPAAADAPAAPAAPAPA